ncbi:hypothetical protein Leryth_015538 [Lithospermum erythrorhizon]|nr:hypothetical protein Leryth_015538 [Lithospermum erythrorhizon]
MAFLASTPPGFISPPSTSNKKSLTSQVLLNGKRGQRFKISCNAPNGETRSNPSPSNSQSVETSSAIKLDRRNVLLGLGGAYGAANLIGDKLALADSTNKPFPYPNLTDCTVSYITGDPNTPNSVQVPYTCCPPTPADSPQPFKIPHTDQKRIRPAAHLVDDKYIEKYMRAIQAMKDLPQDDPRNFYQQANIHCAYCNYGHRVSDPEKGTDYLLQVHSNWFFLPFHRWYLYFFEKIAGELIDDPTFALPYWNWDTPCGMTMPFMFSTEKSPLDPSKSNPLYNPKRHPDHFPPAVFDLNYRGAASGLPDLTTVCNNLSFVYRQMVTNAYDTQSFLGTPYYFGDAAPRGTGASELLHNPAHIWMGKPRTTDPPTYGEDMGNFYSAGKDCLFYVHHANVDRLWRVWLEQGGQNFQNQAWLDSQLFFWDEKKNPVYVTVKDCLDEEKLGYTYQPTELPWLKAKPIPKLEKEDVAANSNAPSVANAFPATLDKVVKVLVQRPKKSRSKAQKKKKKEVLVFEDIEYPMDEFVKFDVFINDEDEVGELMSKAEFAGTFSSVPHGHGGDEDRVLLSGFKIGLGDILEDLQADDDEYILVTIIPKNAGEKVTIDNVRIEFS